MAAERTVRVWEWIAAAHDGDGPVSVAAVGRAAARRLAVDGASVTAVGGPMAREPLFASDAVAARLAELQLTRARGRAPPTSGSGPPS